MKFFICLLSAILTSMTLVSGLRLQDQSGESTTENGFSGSLERKDPESKEIIDGKTERQVLRKRRTVGAEGDTTDQKLTVSKIRAFTALSLNPHGFPECDPKRTEPCGENESCVWNKMANKKKGGYICVCDFGFVSVKPVSLICVDVVSAGLSPCFNGPCPIENCTETSGGKGCMCTCYHDIPPEGCVSYSNKGCHCLGADAKMGASNSSCTIHLRSGAAIKSLKDGQVINSGQSVQIAAKENGCSADSVVFRTSEGSNHPGCAIFDRDLMGNSETRNKDWGNEDVQITDLGYLISCLDGVLYLQTTSASTNGSTSRVVGSDIVLYDVTSIGCSVYGNTSNVDSCVVSPPQEGICEVGDAFTSPEAPCTIHHKHRNGSDLNYLGVIPDNFNLTDKQIVQHGETVGIPIRGNHCSGNSIGILYGTAPYDAWVIIDSDSNIANAGNEDIYGLAPAGSSLDWYELTCEHGVLIGTIGSASTNSNPTPSGSPSIVLYGVTGVGCGRLKKKKNQAKYKKSD